MSGLVFPNVPDVAGVPPLLRNPQAIFNNPSLLIGDVGSLSSFTGQSPGPQWGIFRGSSAVVQADSVNSLDYDQGWRTATFPIEGAADRSAAGGFQSYDKVALPSEQRIRFTAGGSLENRMALLNSVEDIAGDLNLYDVVTPEKTYQNVNIQRFSYSRRATDGVGLLKVDVDVLEIRATATATFTNTQQPSGAGTTNDGTVQPKDATPAQTQSILSKGVDAVKGLF